MLRVNGETVDPALIEDAFVRLKAEAEALSMVSCCERDGEFRAQAVEEVIDGILLAQEAGQSGPPFSAEEIREELESTLRRWREHGASWDLLDAQRDALRDETVADLRMQRFTAALWEKLPPAGEDDLRAWYHRNAARFRRPPAARVLHLVRFPGGGDPWDDYAAMLDLRRRALDGADFADLAREHTAKKSGEIDLGWIELERPHNPFEALLFSLREGEISPVIHYEQAYHLVQPVEIRPVAIEPFEDVVETIRAEFENERRRAALKDLATRLRESAVIER